MADTVITSDKPSFTATNETRLICHVCQKQFSQYTCPRCNSRYCSLQCYKGHSIRCTESFMRENVVEELQQMQTEDETRHKMLEILKRFHSEEDTDYMDEDDPLFDKLPLCRDVVLTDTRMSEETIQKVLAGNQLTMADLAPDERKLFQRAVASGELSKLIAPWNPWWLKPSAGTISFRNDGTQLVVPINNEQEMENPQEANAESLLSEIPHGPTAPLSRVDELIRSEPSPLISVHLIDILFSYCFTMRLYNGDWQSDALGSAITILDMSSVLGQDGKPETVAEALAFCMEQVCSPTYRHAGGLQFAWTLVDDVIMLLSIGRAALICALCDLQRLLQAGERELKTEKRKKAKKGEMSKLRLADRKVYFLMCWVNEQPEEAWSSLSAVVGVDRASVAVLEPSKRVEKGEGKGKATIEEIR